MLATLLETVTKVEQKSELPAAFLLFHAFYSPRINIQTDIFIEKLETYRVVFLTGSALKVLSVEDGKIPTKKVKVGVKTSHILCDIPLLSLFC